MIVWKEKIVINAPIEHVYKVLTDLSYFEKYLKSRKNEILQQLKDTGIRKYKIKLDNLSGELTLVADCPILKFIREKAELNKSVSGRLLPLKEPFIRLGEASVNCKMARIGAETELMTEISSDRNPGLLWKIFIKTLVLVQQFKTRSEVKKFVYYVEKSASSNK